MSDDCMIERYLDEVTRPLVGRSRRKAVRDELRDHLICAIEARASAGLPPETARRDAIAAFGTPQIVARGFMAGAVATLARRASVAAAVSTVLYMLLFAFSARSQSAAGPGLFAAPVAQVAGWVGVQLVAV